MGLKDDGGAANNLGMTRGPDSASCFQQCPTRNMRRLLQEATMNFPTR
jgi:hypothetical protein